MSIEEQLESLDPSVSKWLDWYFADSNGFVYDKYECTDYQERVQFSDSSMEVITEVAYDIASTYLDDIKQMLADNKISVDGEEYDGAITIIAACAIGACIRKTERLHDAASADADYPGYVVSHPIADEYLMTEMINLYKEKNQVATK